MSQALESVSHLLVTPGNPPRDVDGLDHERCAALHNAIFKHGWTASGRAAEDFIPQTRPYVELFPQVLQDDRLQPSTLAFLQLARALPMGHEVNLFYTVFGLSVETGHLEALYYPDADPSTLLYRTYTEFATKPERSHNTDTAIMMFDITDDIELDYPWQKLESILTVWIEMIQRGKIVALHTSIGTGSYE
ncbi:hypothetical protein LTR10_006135 [Elasticomyces elasticus]|nr:hypothetical protein LTR10_006135 [Elasticomyces elasticus]KAK4966814.1 hypothetical protein LTR42_011126 [Elasticomyces elasticus]